MDCKNMNTQYGTKWFTFYTKVRPWLSCLTVLTVFSDFFHNVQVYLNNWWLFLYFVAAVAQRVFDITVAIKSNGNYIEFVHFVKGALLFEIISLAYQHGVQQYIQNDFELGIAFGSSITTFVLGYFIWYRLNVKYFVKRIKTDAVDLDENPNRINEQESTTDLICFCRKCGEKLEEKAHFCSKCGLKVLEITDEQSEGI